jgi:hypothetical protein
MRTGDLVTLSAYAAWRRKSDGKPPLVGIVVRVDAMDESDPKYKYYSKNERTQFYVNWAACNAPISRYGKHNIYGRSPGCFYRNDLKYVRSKE